MICHDKLELLEGECAMSSQPREKFATQVNSEILTAVRALAVSEGRQLQALVDEALADLLEKRKKATPRAHVMGAYLASHEKYAPLYKKLAE
jgi:hypothetical protein